MSDAPKTARIVVIGNEILTGKVVDANTPYLLRRLRQLGIRCTGAVVVPDEVEHIVAALREAVASSDYVFSTGGVGPTHDDVTMEALACSFERPLVESPRIRQLLEERWKGPKAPARFRMALIPEGAELVETPYFPQVRMGPVFVFPGVPSLLALRFPAIEHLLEGCPVTCAAIYTMESESELAPKLEEVDAAFDDISIGSYPRWDAEDHKVLLTVEGQDANRVKAATDRLCETLDAVRLVRVERCYRPEAAESAS